MLVLRKFQGRKSGAEDGYFTWVETCISGSICTPEQNEPGKVQTKDLINLVPSDVLEDPKRVEEIMAELHAF